MWEALWAAVAHLACAGEQSFCMQDDLVCCPLYGENVSIIVPEDDVLH